MPFDTLLINGFALGSVYALIAFGFVAVYKTNRILNFAHAPVGALGALLMASLLSDGSFGVQRFAGQNPLTSAGGHPVIWVLCLLVALTGAGALGVAVERFAIRPMRGRPAFTITTATIGVSIVLQRFADQAPISRRIAVPWGDRSVELFGLDASISSLIVCGLAPSILLALSRFDKTPFGIAARAFASDEEAALAQGIPRYQVMAFAWALAAALGTLAALTFALPPRGYGAFSTATIPGTFFRAIPVLALGGWDSYGGVYLAGLAIGLMQVLSGGLLAGQADILGAGYSTVLPYLVMLLVLLVRPSGLFGQATIRRI